ncbi:MAG: hypothetical protein ABTQ27_18065 [Amaricoccus sp.]|uniref:hypothetical protein n=1 Tax=Amaricoccus sp. TaxID=1872485 RepID=UPI0033154C75
MNAVTPKLSISYDTGDVAYDPVEQEFTLSTEVLTSGFEVALEVTDADQATNVYLLSARLLGTRPSVVGSIANLKLGKGGRTAVATAPVFSGRDLTYSLVAAPVGVSIDAATGLVTIVATAELSAAPITVKARNAAGAATLTFSLTVVGVIATDFTSATALSDVSFLRTLAPSWTHDAGGFARLVLTGNSRAHGDWVKAAGDGLYRVLARWSGATLTPSVDRRFCFSARVGRIGNDWTGIRVETFATTAGDRRLHIREYSGASGATKSLATVNVGWDYDTWYWLDVEISGTSVKGRLYPENGAAPGWQVVATTSVTAAGAFGPGGFPALEQSPTIDIKRLEYHPLAA